MLTLCQFIGNNAMGSKVEWSDRMVSLFGGLWVGGLLHALARRRLPRLAPVVWLFLGVVPILLDGASHTINDIVARTFYAGDARGSFNNLMRNVTGVLFGMLTVWFAYPFIEAAMRDLEYIVIHQVAA